MTTATFSPEAARAHAYSIPLDQIDPSDGALHANNTIGYYMERLRAEDPVHWTQSQVFGNFWSITRYADIMAVDTNHAVFSSDWKNGGGTGLNDRPMHQRVRSFISMDPPEHDVHRNAVSPIVAPANLANIEPLIRERTRMILDSLPRGETFDWVERVSVQLTTMMLCTLLDFPIEERNTLRYWSDMLVAIPAMDSSMFATEEDRQIEVAKMAAYFTKLWNERVNAPPRGDLLSMLAHNPATRNMSPEEFLGNLTLLIVGGNDTTRNSMTGGMYANLTHPEQFAKLRANPKLIESMVPEIVRWQTPLSYMRRTALQDIEFGGKLIRKGDKVAMWYLSGNRDASAIENPEAFIIDRARPRQHLSFGFGIHRCVGNRLAEQQLKILWEEILVRFPVIELAGEPVRVRHSFVHGYEHLPVRIPA